jgi:hypothetical protein
VTSQKHVNWGLDNQGGLWFQQSSTNPIIPGENDVHWIHVDYPDTKMADLDVGRDGMVWGCDANGTPVVREGITLENHNGAAWTHTGDDQINTCQKIAVCAVSGHVWVVTLNHQVMFRQGIYKSNLIGQGWEEHTPQIQVTDVACGGLGQVWMVDINRSLYYKTGAVDRYTPHGDLEPVFVDGGEWKDVSVGENGQMFGLRRANDIWEACGRTGYS